MKLTSEVLKKLIRETIRENSMILSEGLGREYDSLMESMDFVAGDTQTFGIMSAQNPMAQDSLSPEENARRNSELLEDLSSEGKDFVPIDGKYGVDEKSVVINNPSHEDMWKYCGKYQQQSYVWGSDSDSPRYRLMEVVYDQNGESVGSRLYTNFGCKPVDVIVKDDNPGLKSASDNYSELGGRKFVFPFFGMPKSSDEEE